jgi:diguanylate cyclase (GGDEF)-like protein
MLARGLAVRNESGLAYRMAGSQTDISSNKTATEQLTYNAFHDALTDLPNRSLFIDRLQHAITASARRDKSHYAVLFLDMDRFKIINDSLGHLVGDKLLIAVGFKLTECIRPGDTVARLGGDEFSLLLDDVNGLNDAVYIANRIHQKLSIPLMIEGHEVYASVSIGIALGSELYERAEEVLRDADIAMYEAKKRGNSCTEIFDTRMHAGVLDRIQLESELHGVIDHDELTLVYQPILNLNTLRLIGFEALVRWNHPTRGMVYPAEFIPLAEHTGLIIKIGEWILREACRELGLLQRRFPSQPPMRMSINISGKQFAQENLADLVAAIIQETGIDPSSLTIEITESIIMDNIDVAIATMNRLRAMGVHIHIDDFGTGYSSLSYLHSLPIDALKIDRSFINKLTVNGENAEIILSIISLAKSLNFDVIAEGVELAHQLEQMKGMECRLGQGYLFSKPMAPGAIEAWMLAEEFKTSDK